MLLGMLHLVEFLWACKCVRRLFSGSLPEDFRIFSHFFSSIKIFFLFFPFSMDVYFSYPFLTGAFLSGYILLHIPFDFQYKF